MQTATPFVLHHAKPRMAPAAVASLTTHVIVLGALIVLRLAPQTTAIARLPEQLNRSIVWLNDRGPGGGGGGGGTQMNEPPSSARLPGRDPITVPVRKPSNPEPSPSPVNAAPQPDIAVRELASSTMSLPGVIPFAPGLTASQGPGTHGGAGTGDRGGIGPGRGPGLGDGSDGNLGGGPRQIGNGVSAPQLLREVRPAYTSEAMRAKVQGSVIVQCVVNADGSVGDARVTRSLDAVFGLDQEALKAARLWRFRPGTFRGEAVPVLVTIELVFTLR